MKEIQDIYDANRHPTGKKYERWSNLLKTNEYVIVVEIIIFNKQNEILLSRRSANKKRNPLKWETTQGSVKSKEKSQEAAIRELKEELGISVTEDDLRIYKTIKDDSEHIFKDLFWIRKNIKLDEIRFLDGEAIDAMWVTIEKFKEMYNLNELADNMNFNYNYIKDLLNKK